ncbi:MAG: type I glutamate--ammonia ligase [Clostridiaceae bacterium]|jgi:glutamine synthetase|nr:type I glutamate--ammonia ligase [Eubacteriales bacterium]NLV48823.1 type I glutamate--ammonia ligase [Clostridiaceae bacterium]
MPGYTRQDIIRMVEEQSVRFIRLQFTDIFGMIKNIAITPSQLEKALANECMFDGSSIEGFARIEESDMCLHPDLDTFVVFPFHAQQGKIARLICDVYGTDGKPFIGDPRYILRQVIKEAEQLGYTINVGPECEFFLFLNDDKDKPTATSYDEGGYFDLEPVGKGEEVRREIILALEELGFEIEASHHEVAPGQHEIDFRFNEALRAADDIQTFKLTVRSIARKYGMHATFMPKPITGICGSGMHTNISLLKDGQNIFYDPSERDGLSALAKSFIAGMIRHARGICAITNPLVNSYKRLVPGFEAPCYIAWSSHNRSPLIRIPDARGNATRVELRHPDPSCNPYLALALCLASGLEGIRENLTPPPPTDVNIYALSETDRKELNIDSLPGTLAEAIEEMEKDTLVHKVLGPHITQKYLDAKRSEWDDYRTHVTQWERDAYLRKY